MHDSQEFLRFFLSEIQDELTPKINQEFDMNLSYWKNYKISHPSLIDELFAGYFVNLIQCQVY